MVRIDRAALPPVAPPPWVLAAAQSARRGVGRLHAAMALPILRLLDHTVSMAEVSATATFASLGVADHLEDGPRTAADLATAVDVDAALLDRLLRFLATRGIVARRGASYRLTATSDLLRTGHPQSMRDWVVFQGSPWQWHAWEQLGAGLATPDTTPFAHAHGRAYFDHLGHDPVAGAQFDAAMRATSRLQWSLVADALDLTGVGRVCDVGGGTGTALAALLRVHPEMRGTLFELPDVIARAAPVVAEEGVADRVDLVAGDMFDHVPTGADRYLLSAIIHDWADEPAAAILRTVKVAMGPQARILVAELELPDHDGASLERAFDLLMMVLGGGRERSRAEFERLFTASGLVIADDTVLANGWHVHELVAA